MDGLKVRLRQEFGSFTQQYGCRVMGATEQEVSAERRRQLEDEKRLSGYKHSLEVGKRAISDPQTVEVAGGLVESRRPTNNLILMVSGLGGRWFDNIEYIGNQLNDNAHFYSMELRNLGWGPLSVYARDVAQVDAQLRKKLDVDNVLMIGMSAGMNVAVASKNRYGLPYNGLYGLSAFPDFAESRTVEEGGTPTLLQRAIRGIGSAFDFSAFVPITGQKINEPVRFAIADQDECIQTRQYGKPMIEKLVRAFSRFPNSSYQVFPGKNHCFNDAEKYFRGTGPINRDNHMPLVEDIREYADRILG